MQLIVETMKKEKKNEERKKERKENLEKKNIMIGPRMQAKISGSSFHNPERLP